MLGQLEKDWIQYVSIEGQLTEAGAAIWEEMSDRDKKQFYQWMVYIRSFDRRAILLQRQGRIGTYAPLEGQEAAQVGSAYALTAQDFVFPSYREHGVALVQGMPLTQIFLYWMGRVEGCKAPTDVRVLPPAVPIATQIPHAVGAAWASKLKKEKEIAIAYFGDGATSEGDFHEACNFSGVFQVPVILFCQNNGYAISVPFSRQSASETVAEKAKAYNFPGYRVDGNDVLAVYDVTKRAIERARRGEGPTLIEAVTYRKGSHTTADDARRYRPQAEVDEWIKERDPIARYRKLLVLDGLLDEREDEDWRKECDEKIDQAIREAESLTPLPPEHVFTHLFAQLSKQEKAQQAELREER
ncbi:pyruvate dehydrogenase (acetyl-transferring) E1 component subunit alpha [Hazenella sp. IB182353]|uniref:pyruvate dehydrogenase (acetyl-transferring) E1 component subunit alpha n=1 Tax=Polycladospora coralii TaxID=2771432 RepID=UPI0017464D98|nr:pyruvate dehydrogenase (acetyl-transferring) E1 component subunit alpha [Polycladospora coralii]MBS7531233.1 pyruvate dehydrogenase (acetyl-transferring) E1 component subunit alpha [Polycladospora coralii]